MIKTGKKFILKSECGKFKVVLGAVQNHNNPISIYFKITSWLSYNDSSASAKDIINTVKSGIKTFLRNHPLYGEYFKYTMVIDVNVSESRVRLGQVTYFELDVTLFQKDITNGLPLSSLKPNKLTLKSIILKMLPEMLNTETIKENPYVSFHFDKNDAKEVIKNKTLEI